MNDLLSTTHFPGQSKPLARGVYPLANAARLETSLHAYEPITLAQMDTVALMDRLDIKYALSVAQLEQVLRTSPDHYRVLEVAGRRANSYQTLYFDTSAFELYLHHHAGLPKRLKVRSRRYVESNRSFLEVKFKNYQRTHKERIETDDLVTTLDGAAGAFLDQHTMLKPHTLEPKLWNDFVRITLASKAQTERVTLDVDLSFANAQHRTALPGIVIVEVKQMQTSHRSAFVAQLHALHVQPMRLSKYCVGVAMLYPNVKHNHFKPILHALNKISRSHSYAD